MLDEWKMYKFVQCMAMEHISNIFLSTSKETRLLFRIPVVLGIRKLYYKGESRLYRRRFMKVSESLAELIERSLLLVSYIRPSRMQEVQLILNFSSRFHGRLLESPSSCRSYIYIQ
jgi:hypothetical protein